MAEVAIWGHGSRCVIRGDAWVNARIRSTAGAMWCKSHSSSPNTKPAITMENGSASRVSNKNAEQ